MKYLNLSGQIGNDMLNALIEFTNANQEQDMTIFFSSPGGYTNEGHSMVRILNNHFEKITIVVGVEVYSFALDVLLQFKGLIVISNPVVSLIHKVGFTSDSRDQAKKGTKEYIMKKQVDEENKKYITTLYKLLNKGQVSVVEQNDDLVLDTDDLIKMLKRNGNNLRVEL